MSVANDYELALIEISRATDAAGRMIVLLHPPREGLPRAADFRKAIGALVADLSERTVFLDGFGTPPLAELDAEKTFACNLELLVRGWRACLAYEESRR